MIDPNMTALLSEAAQDLEELNFRSALNKIKEVGRKYTDACRSERLSGFKTSGDLSDLVEDMEGTAVA